MILTWRDEILWFALAFALPAALALGALRSRPGSAERAYAWVLIAQSAWVLGQALELSVGGLDTKLWLDGLQVLPMCASAGFGMVFAHRVTSLPLRRRALAGFCVISVLATVYYSTAPLHGLARRDASVVRSLPFDALTYSFDVGDALLFVLVLAVWLYSNALLVRHFLRVHRAQVAGVVPVMVGFALPSIAMVIGLNSPIRVLGQRDISFVVFGLAGLVVAFGIRRRGSLAIVPVARELVFDRIPDPALVFDARGVLLELNGAAAGLLGITSLADNIGRSLRQLEGSAIATDTLLAPIPGRREVVVGRQTFELYREDLRDLGGTLLLIRNVTDQVAVRRILERDNVSLERKVAERGRKIEETERKFRAIFDQTFQLIGVLDPNGTVLEANAAALDMLGVEVDSVLGKPFWETPWWRHSPELRERLREAVERARQGEFVRFEATHPLDDGSLRQVDFSLKPVRDSAGNVTMLIPEGRDITELREAEAQLMQVQKLDALGRLAGGVAHDFNNLLTVIDGNVQLALMDEPSADIAASLALVRDAVKNASALTQQLLTFGRKSLGAVTNLDVAARLVRLDHMLRRLLPEHITVKFDVPDDLWRVRFDETQFDQILINLALNARDAMPQGGRLTVSARNVSGPGRGNRLGDREWIRIDVADDGCGMTKAQLEKIFEPFFTTKSAGRGTGLGLSIVYGALQQHGGSVEVKSAPDEGSCFTLHFPRAATEAAIAAPPSSQDVAMRNDGTLVFVVEDEVTVRATVERLLLRHGFSVCSFSSASVLAELSEQLEQPDVVLTDAVMPGMSGYDFLQYARRAWPGVPVVLMSGYAEDDRLGAEVAGGVEFVSKPFTPADLVTALTRAVRRARSRSKDDPALSWPDSPKSSLGC